MTTTIFPAGASPYVACAAIEAAWVAWCERREAMRLRLPGSDAPANVKGHHAQHDALCADIGRAPYNTATAPRLRAVFWAMAAFNGGDRRILDRRLPAWVYDPLTPPPLVEEHVHLLVLRACEASDQGQRVACDLLCQYLPGAPAHVRLEAYAAIVNRDVAFVDRLIAMPGEVERLIDDLWGDASVSDAERRRVVTTVLVGMVKMAPEERFARAVQILSLPHPIPPRCDDLVAAATEALAAVPSTQRARR